MRGYIFLYLVILIFLSLSCEGPQGPMGPVGPPGSGMESLTDPTIMPKVLSTFPPDNSTGPYEMLNNSSNIIQVRFNKIMDQSTIKRAFSISSPGLNIRIDTFSIYSFGGDLIWLYVDDSLGYSHRWKLGNTYTFGIASTAKDINGNSLIPSYSMTFLPEPYFRIRTVYPQNGATDVPSYTSICLVFNSPVDTSIRSFIQINPPIPGMWLLVDSYDSTYLYYSYTTPPLENTTYTISIQQSAKDQYGNQLQQSFTSSFTTRPFRVSYTYPSDGRENVPLTQSIEIGFTNIIDTSTVRNSFNITPAVQG
ncbi:MAG: Ig-like domain-containing protein, partial [Ignavibacteriales bacterium]|nr:Ig-like domain-containing protein [Ignavibacteriales bacterium]